MLAAHGQLSPAEEGNYMIRARVDYEITKPVITTPEAGYITNEETVTIEGKASPTTTIQLNNNGEEVATAEIGDDGAFSFDANLTEGDNKFVATTLVNGDAAGSSEPVTITLDTVAPTLTIDSPVDGDVTNRETVTVEGTVSGRKSRLRGSKRSASNSHRWKLLETNST